MDIINLARHLFVPRYSNNHKAKLLHPSSLFVLIAVLVMTQFAFLLLPKTGVKILGYAANISPAEVIRLTNIKRAENGLPEVRQSAQLTAAALAKGTDMINRNYWAHVGPENTQPWFFFTQAGYNYKYAGENLARDFSNPAAVVEAWMASSSHRDNMLSGKYNEIGIAVVEGDLNGVDTTIVVQFFGTKQGESIAQVPPAQAAVQQTEQVTPSPTAVPTIAPVQTPEASLAVSGNSQLTESGVANKDLVSPFDTTKAMSVVTVVSLLGVMAIDGYVISKKRITRVGGRTFAHLSFLGMILAIILIAKVGAIL